MRGIVIKIEVFDRELDELVGTRETYSIETAEQILGDIPKWVEQFENKRFMECDQCGRMIKVEDLSTTDDGKYIVCQDCLEKIISGGQKLKEQ
jgi:DNA-directed RNA polymerase subunit RPC12/RpoP